jgi:hypothetical protein
MPRESLRRRLFALDDQRIDRFVVQNVFAVQLGGGKVTEAQLIEMLGDKFTPIRDPWTGGFDGRRVMLFETRADSLAEVQKKLAKLQSEGTLRMLNLLAQGGVSTNLSKVGNVVIVGLVLAIVVKLYCKTLLY